MDANLSKPGNLVRLAGTENGAPGLTRRRRAWMWATTIVAATFIAYIPALRAGFVWDDGEYLYDNDLVQSENGLGPIWSIRSDADSGQLLISTPQYYPLVYTTFWLEHRVWGLAPAGYHAVNVLLHALSALLLWRIGVRIGLPGAWFVAGVFALHPVHVESAAWITERKNVLSGFFYFLSLATFLAYFERRQAWRYLLGLVLFTAALLSKTVTCSLPVAILLILWFQRRRIGIRDALALTPVFVVGAAGGLFTAYLERMHVGAESVDLGQTLLERSLLIAPRAFLFYAEKIAWPHPLIFIYPRWEVAASAWSNYIPLAVVLSALGAAALTVKRFGWGPLLLLAFSGATLTPALGFFQVYPHRFSWVADHFQYLGSLGFIAFYVAVLAWIGRRLLGARAGVLVARVGGAGVLLMLGALTFQHGRSFKDAVTLWEDTLAANPDAWIASINLGIRASEDGRYDRAAEHFEHAVRYPTAGGDGYSSWGNAMLRVDNMDGAIEKFRQALVANPADAKAHVGMAVALGRLGRLDEARESLEAALAIQPDYVTALLNLGMLHARQGRWDKAEYILRRARALLPHAAQVRLEFANILFDTRRWKAAAGEYAAARRLAPKKFAATPKLAKSLFESGEYAESVRVCVQGLSATPDNERLLRLLARIKATCPVDEIRDGAEAIHLVERLPSALRRDARVSGIEACAYAEMGDFDKAAALATVAADAARRRGALELAERLESHARLFRSNEPYRHEPR